MSDKEVVIKITAKNLTDDDFEKARRNIAGLGEESKRRTQETRGFMAAMQSFGSTASGTFAGMLSAIGVTKALGSAFDFTKQAVFGMNATLETTTLQFTTLMGNSDQAKAHVRDLFEIAKKTPFETGPIIEASRMLQTFGGSALNTKATILLLGDAAAATGAPINELGMWVGRMYAQMQAGRPFGEASQRLGELAVMGPKVRMQLEDMQKSGASADAMFKVFTDSIGTFSGAMEAQAATWGGVTSTFTDTISIMLSDSFKPFFETVRDGLGMINTALGSDGVSKAFTEMGQAVASALGPAGAKGAAKAFADGLVFLGQSASFVAEVVYKAFHVIKGVVALAGTVVLAVITGIVEATAKGLDFAAKLDPSGKLAQFAASAHAASNSVRGLALAWGESAKASGNALVGHDAFVASMTGMRSALGAVRNELGKTSTATEETAVAAKRTGDAFNTHLGDDGAGAAKSIKSLQKHLQALDAEVKSGMRNLSDADFMQEFASKVRDAIRDAATFGKEVPRHILEAAERINSIQISLFQTQGAANAREEFARIQKELAAQLERDQKASLDRLQSGTLANLQATAAATEASYERRKKAASTAFEYELHLIEEEGRKRQEALDRHAAGYEAAMTAIAQDTAEQMAAAREAHNRELAAMQTEVNAWGGAFQRVVDGIPGLLQQALTGGGGMAGFGKALRSMIGQEAGGALTSMFAAGGPLNGAANAMTGGLSKIFGKGVGDAFAIAIPGIGSLIGSLAGPLLDKLGGLVSRLFGGPSKTELEGRSAAADIRRQLEATLTVQQKLEAGSDQWKKSVIALRDAYILAGHTGEEALAISDRLWRAEKEGPEAVKRVLEEISRALTEQFLPDSQRATAIAALGFDEVLRMLRDFMGKTREASDIVGDFGTTAGGALDQVQKETQIATSGIETLGGVWDEVARRIGEPITIKIKATFEGLSDAQRAAGQWQVGSYGTKTYEELLARFIENNPGDYDRAADALADEARRAAAMTNTPGTMHSGGLVRRAHSGWYVDRLASDEVPIIAQVDEGILSARRGMPTLARMMGMSPRAALDTLNSGGAGAADAMPIVINLYVAQDRSGRVTMLGESDRRQIQDWFLGGRLQVPARAVSQVNR